MAEPPQLTHVGYTSYTHKPTATWTLPAGTDAAEIDFSRFPGLATNSYFVKPYHAWFPDVLSPDQTRWKGSFLTPLHPGTYYLKVSGYDASLAALEWSDIASFTLPDTQAPTIRRRRSSLALHHVRAPGARFRGIPARAPRHLRQPRESGRMELVMSAPAAR